MPVTRRRLLLAEGDRKVRSPDLRDYVLTSVFDKAALGAIDFR
jgi:hypothetical protein